MKKTILLTLTFLSLIIFACAKEEKNSDKITLKIFHQVDKADDVVAANFGELLEEFARLHPNIELDFDYLANEPYHNKLQAMNVSNQLPDLMFLWPGKRTGNVTRSGKIKDLRPWLKGQESNFAPAALTPQGANGEIYELPEQVTATHVMYTNNLLLKELGLSFPKTLDELIAQGKTIRDAGYIPIAMDNKDGWQMQSTLLSALVERTAGRKWLEDAKDGKASFADPEFVQALAVIKRLSDEKMFSPGINQAEYGRALTDFGRGNAVYFIDGGWRVSNLRKEASEELQENMELNVFPELPNERGQAQSSSIIAGTGFGMNANLEGEKADAAWEWIWFFSGPEGGKIKLQQGWLPAYKLPTDDLAPLSQKLSAFLGDTPGGYVIDGIMDAEGMAVLNSGLQEMMFGDISPQELGSKYEAWVAKNETSRN